MLIDTLILLAGVLLTLGIASSKLSARLGMPVLAMFLGIGMLAGTDGIGGIEFDNYELAYSISSVALVLILFDGGLGTSLISIKSAWKPSLLLATVGVVITAVITGAAASWFIGLNWLEGLLLGSIVGSTDAAAVFSVMRSGGVSLSKRLSSVLEVESASNDPMAIFLTLGCIDLLFKTNGQIQGDGLSSELPGLIGFFFLQMGVGTICGILGGYFAVWIVNRIELNASGLYPILVSSLCLLVFGTTVLLKGSGFLAVFLCGVVIGNSSVVFQRGIRLFHDAGAWLSQVILFVVLGLLSTPSRLVDISGKALLVSAVLIFLARPLAVMLSVFPFKFNWQELSFISWVGLKGAVPITLATFPLMMATPERPLQATLIFDVVFFIVVVSAIVQGTSLTPIARLLGLEKPKALQSPVTLEINSLKHYEGAIVDYAITEGSRAAGRQVKHLGLPAGAVIALVARGNHIIPPQGNTEILVGDHLILVLRPDMEPLVNRILGQGEDQSLIPTALEFPLRAKTRIETFGELYQIPMDAQPEATLGEAILEKLGKPTASPGDCVRFGPIVLRVLQLDNDDQIDLVGMSILPLENTDVVKDVEAVTDSSRENPHPTKKAHAPTDLPPQVESNGSSIEATGPADE